MRTPDHPPEAAQQPDGPPPAPGRRQPEDPFRRIALLVAAIVLPVIVALVVIVNVVNRSPSSDGAVADVSGATPTSTRSGGALPVLDVNTPPVSEQVAASCTPLMQKLPAQLDARQNRDVRADSPYVQAWGDPAVVLVCGAGRPAGFTASAQLIQINDVQWYVDSSNPNTVVWTAVDRPVYVQVRVPSSVDSGPVAELTAAISAALPAQAPSPAP